MHHLVSTSRAASTLSRTGRALLLVLAVLIATLVVFVQGEPEVNAATPAEQQLTEGIDYEDTTENRLIGPVEQTVSFTALDPQPGQQLVITRVEISAFGLAEFNGWWAVVRDGATSGAGVRQCIECDGGQSLSVVLADSETGGQEMALNSGSTVEVHFNDDIAEDYSRYDYEVYGFYKDATEAQDDAVDSKGADEETADSVVPEESIRESDNDSEETPLGMLERAVMPFSLMAPLAATAPIYSSPWANNPGPLATSTHTLTTNKNAWTERFALGGETGASISKLSYRYTGDSTQSITMAARNFSLKIDGIIDTAQTGTPTRLYGGSNPELVGNRYPILDGGTTVMYLDVVIPHNSYGFPTIPKGVDFIFRDLKLNPVNLEVPAHTPVTMTYTWGKAPTNPRPETATLTVNGSSTGVNEPTEPGGSDPITDPNNGVCTTSGGTVWVGVSAHTNPSSTFNDRNTTQLYRQVYGNTTFEKVGAAANWVYNALAYNPNDGYLYAISQGRLKTPRSAQTGTPTYDEDRNYPAGHLLRVSPENGSVTDLGLIGNIQRQSPGRWPNDLWGGITSGVITATGDFIFSNSSKSGTKDQYVLNLNGIGTRPTATQLRATSITANLQSNDYSFFGDSSDGYIYGMRNSSTILERIEIATGRVTEFDMSGVRDPLGNVMNSAIYGTAWTYPNGNLGFGRNGTNLSYQIEVYDSTATSFRARLVSVAPAPTSQSNDAASNALVVGDANLAIEKKLVSMENGQATWEITVSNLGPCGSSGFSVTDLVPSDKYSDVRFDFLTNGWVSNNVTNGNTLVALHGPLENGQKATLRLTAKFDASTSRCVENTASVFGNEKDPNLESNSDSDGACALRIVKDVVDVNRDGVIDGADGMQPGPTSGTRQIQYSITVTNPDTKNANTYTLTDTPQFSNLVTVTGGQVTRPDGTEVNLSGGGPYTLATDKQIKAGATEKYQITVYYTPPAAGSSMETAECRENTPGAGLFNEAKITFTGGEETDDGCAPIVEDESVTLFLRKVGADNRTIPLTGARFAVLDEKGNVVADMSAPDPANGNFYSASSLKKDTTYFLVETQSPVGYSLLPQRVEFTITNGANGNAQVVSAENTAVIGVVEGSSGVQASPSEAFITIADFRQGDLPRTGGLGYMPWALGATILMLLGAVTARRKSY